MLYENEALGTSTIIAENRQKRPNKVKGESMCPFCKQNESAIEQIMIRNLIAFQKVIGMTLLSLYSLDG